MNVDWAMACALTDKFFWEKIAMNVDEALLVAAKQGGLPETDEWHAEVIDALDVLSAEVDRLRAELAAAKAASVCPVELVALGDADWECSVGVKCKSSEDADTLYNWLRQKTGNGITGGQGE